MPIFDYKCTKCGKITEFLINSINHHEIRCPECGNKDLERLISSASYIIKNSASIHGTTCCGREERCDTPSCEAGRNCRRG
jgi:putative FmdB family regulatory protein